MPVDEAIVDLRQRELEQAEDALDRAQTFGYVTAAHYEAVQKAQERLRGLVPVG